MAAHVAREHSGIDIVATPCGCPDKHGNLLAGEKIRGRLRAGLSGAARHAADNERNTQRISR
jgi:hypothetical protein